MARIEQMPIPIPKGVTLTPTDGKITVKGAKTTLSLDLPEAVRLEIKGDEAHVAAVDESSSRAIGGTMRALINNMVVGVTTGFERKLTLVGVGYRAQVQGKKLNLSLGYSHPINYDIPEGITIETPSATEIVVKGADKQVVGQVAADIRDYRRPEPYKGKGVRYSDERVVMKEAKKK